MERETLPPLLCRYFFFGWLFRDVGRGTQRERLAAWRHNQEHAHWLLVYLKRWLVLGVMFFAAGAATATVHGHWVSVPFYVMFSVAVPVSSVIVVAWLGLRLLPGP